MRIAVGWLALCTLARVSATGLPALKGPLLLFKSFSLFHLRGWPRAVGPACITVPFHFSAYLASQQHLALMTTFHFENDVPPWHL